MLLPCIFFCHVFSLSELNILNEQINDLTLNTLESHELIALQKLLVQLNLKILASKGGILPKINITELGDVDGHSYDYKQVRRCFFFI